ncbi:MAG: ComEC/Rec2 family competence protein [Actinomycetota bacterium]
MIGSISVPARWCLLAAASTWLGVVVGFSSAWMGGALSLMFILTAVFRPGTVVVIAAGFVVVGVLSGLVAGERRDAIHRAWVPEGRVVVSGQVAEEASGTSYGRAVLQPQTLDGAPWHGPRIAVTGMDPATPAGTAVTLSGTMRPRVARVRDEIVAATLRVDEALSVEVSRNPVVWMGNTIRDRVTAVYGGDRRTDGLVRGLLIGDTDLLPASEEEDLRRAGLAHYVAVSGSNVAMFLAAWWFMTAPIAVRPKLRVVGGMVGLAVFAVVTRWEPSVIRASIMAAVPLVGGLVGIPFDPWMALGTAVTLLLLVSGHLAFSVGFQLSVAATGGVLVGIAMAKGRRPGWLYMPLFATMGAQLAVAPVILVVFGVIPLLAPVANLVVGPVVAFTTAVGGVGIILPFVAPLADRGAALILFVGRIAAQGPQLGALAAVGTALVGSVVAWRGTRALGIAVVAVAAMVALSAPSSWPTEATLVVLDVGQGDAILLQDPSGVAVLVDGGPDPRTLDRALRRNGVRRLALVVVTHGDLDHVGGVVELLGSGRVEEFWIPEFVSEEGLLAEAVEAAGMAGVTIRRVVAGDRFTAASFRIDVISPARRYLSDNDGSVVMWVTAARTALLAGDAEAVAQADLPPLRPDVMVVPHHGSGTTDRRWLVDTVGDMAILSYGENRYGHPNPEILAVLDDEHVEVRHTHLEGDIAVPLGRAP